MTFDWLDEMPKEMKVSPSNILDDSWDNYRTEILKQSEFFLLFFFCLCLVWNHKRWMLPSFNPLGPNIQVQILQSDLRTFPLRIRGQNLMKDQGILSLVIILSVLLTLSLENVWIMLGENWCWSLLGLKGLTRLVDTRQWINARGG